MLLRRITKHVTDQNWFAVFIDFLIVVLGVYIGLQVQEWALEKDRQDSEKQYLERVDDEILELIQERGEYDDSRQRNSQSLKEISVLLNNNNPESVLSDQQCRHIAMSSYTTVPPAELPSVTELISSGRLDQIASTTLRKSILSYVQDVSRARDLIFSISESSTDIARAYPKLLITEMTLDESREDGIDLKVSCDINKLRESIAFMNDFNINALAYVVYTEGGVLQVSEKLADMHLELDKVLNVNHPVKQIE